GQLCGTNGGSARQAAPMLGVKRCAAESGSGELSFFHRVWTAPPWCLSRCLVLGPTGRKIRRKLLLPPRDDVADRPTTAADGCRLAGSSNQVDLSRSGEDGCAANGH